jgi:hypothetical protein
MSSVVVTLKGRIMEKQVRVVLSARNEMDSIEINMIKKCLSNSTPNGQT